MSRRIAFAASVLLSLTLVACSSSTEFITDPPGADVYVDGEYVGETPVKYSSRSPSASTQYLEIEKDGYKPIRRDLRKNGPRNRKAIATYLIGGIFLVGLPAIAWGRHYPRHIEHELEPEAGRVQIDADGESIYIVLSPVDDE